MGHKEQRILRYIWIPLSITIIGLILYFLAGHFFTDNIAAQISYVMVQGEPKDSSNGSDIRLSDIAEGTNGDTDDILKKGAGQSFLSGFPGQQKTVLVGGHDTTFFAPLENVKEGDSIVLACTYGSFEYKVSQINIIDGADFTISDTEEQLVLYTCYPFGKTGVDRTKKIVYICDKVSGPEIGGSGIE